MLSIDVEKEALEQSQSVSLKGSKQQRKLSSASVQPLGPIIHHQGNLDFALMIKEKRVSSKEGKVQLGQQSPW